MLARREIIERVVIRSFPGAGNHFYNHIHSQIRNNLPDHETRDYIYVFEHFEEYHTDLSARRKAIDRINEIERWVNTRISEILQGKPHRKLLNPHRGRGYVAAKKRQERYKFRTPAMAKKVEGLIRAVEKELA